MRKCGFTGKGTREREREREREKGREGERKREKRQNRKEHAPSCRLCAAFALLLVVILTSIWPPNASERERERRN